MIRRSLPSSVRSVLVLTKYRFIGDTVVAAPLLAGARRAFPEARITLLCGPSAATVLQHCPDVDRIQPYDPYKAQRGTINYLRLMRLLRTEEHPDLCLVANRSFQSALSALFCGGRIRAGFDSEGRGCLLTHPVAYDGSRREVECYLDILRAVAPDSPEHPYDPRPHLTITEAERAHGGRILADREAIGPRLVGLQPGASYPAKQWSPEKFAAVADALAGDGAGVVILGGPGEEETARAMQQAMHAPAVNLVGSTKIRETMSILSHLSLFVGNDTGVNHIAAALGVPTVGMFGPTSASKWGNAGPDARVLVAPEGDMEKIKPSETLEAARVLLSQARPAVGVRL